MSVVSVQPVGAPSFADMRAALTKAKNKALGMVGGRYTAQDAKLWGEHCVDAIEPGDESESAETAMSRKKTGYLQSCRDLYEREVYKQAKESADDAMKEKVDAARQRVCAGGAAEKKWRAFCDGTS